MRVSVWVLVGVSTPFIVLSTHHIVVIRRSQAWVANNDALWRSGVPVPDFRWIRQDGPFLLLISVCLLAACVAGLTILASAMLVSSRQRPGAWLRFAAVVVAVTGVAATRAWSLSAVPESTPGAWPTLTHDVVDLSLTLGSLILLVLVVLGLVAPLARNASLHRVSSRLPEA